MGRMPRSPVRLSVRFYRALLIIYPPAHRRAYGPLMLQLFRDQCRDAIARGGVQGLVGLWAWTLADLIASAATAHIQAAREVIMAVNRTLAPMPWRGVLLVVVPGVLVGVSRVYYPVQPLTMISFALVVILTAIVLAARRHLPAWGLLVAGLAVNMALLWVGILVMRELGTRLRVEYGIRHLLVAIPLWAAIAILAWKYRHIWRFPVWVLVLFALVIIGGTAFNGYSVLSVVGLMLLPVALGLPLSQRHGPFASLFVVGAYSLWLFDSDYYSGYILRDTPFYPVYVLLLSWLFVSVAPLLLVRARSQRGRAVGLLAPIAVVLIARVAVPWLMRPDFHPSRIWIVDTLLSGFTGLILVLALVLYSQSRSPQASANTLETGRPAYSG